MKLAVVFFAVLGLAYTLPAPQYTLHEDLDDFMALIPKEKFVALYHKYENDADIKKIVAYLKSKDFAAVMHIIAGVPEVQDLVKYIEKQGVPVVELLNKLADRLGLPHWPGYYSRAAVHSSRSWRDFLNEAKELIPLDKVSALVLDKLANSADFSALYEKIASVDYQRLHDQALTHPEIVNALDRLKALGVDTKKVWEFIKTIFGWTYSTFNTRSLRDDFDDFEKLIPMDEIKAAWGQCQSDPQIQQVIKYLESSEFTAVLNIIYTEPNLNALRKYLDDRDIKATKYVNEVLDYLHQPHVPSTYSRSIRSVRTCMDTIEALIPMEDMVALALEKMTDSPSFVELYEIICGVDGQSIHDKALTHPEIVDMIKRAEAVGINVEEGWVIVKSLCDW